MAHIITKLNSMLCIYCLFWLLLCREPIKCGDTIRLQHLQTRLFLHSHYFQSPLSSNQEVSCFGDGRDSKDSGDDGDNWQVECSTENWRRDDPVRFKHSATQK